MRRILAALGFCMALTLGATASHAITIVNGRLWVVSEAAAEDASPANIPARPADILFKAPSDPLSFNIGDSIASTIGDFLATGGAFEIVENTVGTLASIANNTLWEFTGLVTVTTGQVFSVAHDDGLTLIIGGIDLGFDTGPTAPVVTDKTYTGPSGTFPFQLVYGECCAGAAVLLVDLPFESAPAVPAPAPILLLLTSVTMLGLARRR